MTGSASDAVLAFGAILGVVVGLVFGLAVVVLFIVLVHEANQFIARNAPKSTSWNPKSLQ